MNGQAIIITLIYHIITTSTTIKGVVIDGEVRKLWQLVCWKYGALPLVYTQKNMWRKREGYIREVKTIPSTNRI